MEPRPAAILLSFFLDDLFAVFSTKGLGTPGIDLSLIYHPFHNSTIDFLTSRSLNQTRQLGDEFFLSARRWSEEKTLSTMAKPSNYRREKT